jgi:hypothetical protein
MCASGCCRLVPFSFAIEIDCALFLVFDASHVFSFIHSIASSLFHCLALSIVVSPPRTRTDAIRSYDYALGPLLTPFIEESNDAVLVRAALRCFPAIRHSDPQKVMRNLPSCDS